MNFENTLLVVEPNKHQLTFKQQVLTFDLLGWAVLCFVG
jgi:hypothetical protein